MAFGAFAAKAAILIIAKDRASATLTSLGANVTRTTVRFGALGAAVTIASEALSSIPNAVKAFGGAIGILTVADATAQLISFEQAARSVHGAVAAAGGTTEEFNDKLTALEDAVSKDFISGLAASGTALQGIAQLSPDSIGKFAEAAETLGQHLNRDAVTIFEAFVDAFVKGDPTALQNVAESVGIINAETKEAQPLMDEMLTAMEASGPITNTEKLADTVGTLRDRLGGTVGEVGEMLSGFADFGFRAVVFTLDVLNVLKEITAFLLNITFIGPTVKAIFLTIATISETAFTPLKIIWEDIWKILKLVFEWMEDFNTNMTKWVMVPFRGFLDSIKEWMTEKWVGPLQNTIDLFEKIWEWIEKLGGKIGEFLSGGFWDLVNYATGGIDINIPGFASGGVVPGPIGAPVPAIVHGGERIIPAGGGGGGGTTVQLVIDRFVLGEVVVDLMNREGRFKAGMTRAGVSTA